MINHILQFAKSFKIKIIYIRCVKNTWIENWLKRKSFEFYKDIDSKQCLHKWEWLQIKI